MNNVRVHGQLSFNDVFKIESHFVYFLGQRLQPSYFIRNLFRQVAHGHILDVSQQMLNSDLLSLSRLNGRRDMNEILDQLAFFVDFLDTAVGLCGDGQLVGLLDLGHNKDRVRVIASVLFVDLDVCLSNSGT